MLQFEFRFESFNCSHSFKLNLIVNLSAMRLNDCTDEELVVEQMGLMNLRKQRDNLRLALLTAEVASVVESLVDDVCDAAEKSARASRRKIELSEPSDSENEDLGSRVLVQASRKRKFRRPR